MAQVTIATGFDVDYYLDQVGADYYLNAAGEPPGIWAGSAAPGRGLVGEVDPDVMRALYHHDVGLEMRSKPAASLTGLRRTALRNHRE